MEVCEMQKADMVLSILGKKSGEDKDFVFDRLYRNLFNEDFYIKAYVNVCTKAKYVASDGFNMEIVKDTIEKLKSESYYPIPLKETHIPEEKGNFFSLGKSDLMDNLVQEILRMLLVAIFEVNFLDSSHGFRQNRSCQTALYRIKTTCQGTNWVIRGGMENLAVSIDQKLLINLIGRRIADGRFLELLRRFLKAGYFNLEKPKGSLSETLHGSGISPVLANIYLHELDMYIEGLINDYLKSYSDNRNPVNQRLNCKDFLISNESENPALQNILDEPGKPDRLAGPDKDCIKIKYTRYAEECIICIKGNKSLAEEIRKKINDFLQSELKLETELKISNLSDSNVKFLGYEIAKGRHSNVLPTDTPGAGKKDSNEAIRLLVPGEVINRKLKPFMKNGKSVHHGGRVNLPVKDIINEYNSEVRELYNYYSLADDVSTKLKKFKYYHYYSLAKTIARKEKCPVKKVIEKYGIDVKSTNGTGTHRIIGVTYETDSGPKTVTYFNEPFKKSSQPKVSVLII